ncbi:hypothetical protein COCVIDRAFT_116762, partial [Bipolaris victoriae FI3]
KIISRNLIVLIKNRARITELALSTKVSIEDIILEEILFTSKNITNLKNYA